MELLRSVFTTQKAEGRTLFVRYCLVSGIALTVDVAILTISHDMLEWHYLLATTIGFVAGVIANYLLCIVWVFSDSRFSSRGFEFLLTAGIATAGLLINDLLMWLMISQFSMYYLVAKAMAAVAVFFWNFIIRQYYVHAPAVVPLEAAD